MPGRGLREKESTVSGRVFTCTHISAFVVSPTSFFDRYESSAPFDAWDQSLSLSFSLSLSPSLSPSLSLSLSLSLPHQLHDEHERLVDGGDAVEAHNVRMIEEAHVASLSMKGYGKSTVGLR